MIVVFKSHPATQAMSGAARPADLVDGDTRRNPGEPSAEQAEADAYKKPLVQWRGLTIAIENPAGSVRRGTNRHGVSWEIRMRFDYGEVVGSMGVDGDPVDIYLGPALEDAPMVYVVHQRKVNDWDAYDEDKVMAGFMTEEDARQAFLSNYNDPRFLGPITAMPVDEFIAKVKATKEKPAMIKAILFFKGFVGPYLRGGRVVNARGYHGRSAQAQAMPGQMSLFGGPQSGKPLPPSPLQGKDAVAHTPDMFADEPKHTEPTRELIAEHEHLVDVLNSPSHADDKAEAKKQGEELKEMKQEVRDPKADYNAAVTSTKEGPTDDNPRRKFYVTIAREGRGVSKLAGPFDTHDEAKGHVNRARDLANEIDPRSAFDAFGTAGVEADEHKPGVLNERLGIKPKAAPYTPVTDDAHPAPKPRGMLGLVPEDRRDEWLDRYRQQHELHHYELGQVREKMDKHRSKLHRAQDALREAEAGLKMAQGAPVPDQERERAAQAAVDKHHAEYTKLNREMDGLVGQHQNLHERVAKMGREQERIYGASGDMDLDMASMRKRDPEAQRQHERDMLKMYREHYKAKDAKPKAKVTPQVASDRQLDGMIKIAADSIDKLRQSDVDRVISEAPAHFRRALASHIKGKRPDLAAEVDDVMAESGQPMTKSIVFVRRPAS